MAFRISLSLPFNNVSPTSNVSVIPVTFVYRIFCSLLAALACACVCIASSLPGAAAKRGVASNYGQVPLSFEANRGQLDKNIQFFSRGLGYGLFLTPGEAVLELERTPAQTQQTTGGIKAAALPAPESLFMHMKLVGANAAAPAAAEEQLPGVVNYFRGNDPDKWTKDVPTYKRVRYTGVYPGVDLVYYGNQRQLEYDFVVAPGADPKRILLNFADTSPRINAQGDLLLATNGVVTSFRKPVVYQMAGGVRKQVAGAYVVEGQHVAFALGNYDQSKPLVIDPVLFYGTFLGGSADDRGTAIAADEHGNTYIVGDTVSLNFPLENPYQSTNHDTSNGWVVFVSKLSPDGTALIYSTFLGGVADSHALSVAVDASEDAYVAGYTSAGDYPVTAEAFQTVCGGNASNIDGVHARSNGCRPSGDTNGFITKLSLEGNSLVYSTFLGGSNFTQITGIAVDPAGEAYVTGNTNANCGPGPYWTTNHAYPDSWDCFPTTSGALKTILDGQWVPGSTIWAFFTKLNTNGTGLVYSTLFGAPKGTDPEGGSLSDTAYAVAVDTAGNGYIAGNAGYGIPTTSSAFYVPPANSSKVLPPYPGFVAKFNPALSGQASLVYSTFLGSSAQTAKASDYSNVATGLAVDSYDEAIVTGYTNVCGYPTTPGAFQTRYNSAPYCQDGFVTMLNPEGTGLVWSTILGSYTSKNITSTQLSAVALGSNGHVYVIGTVGGSSFPTAHPLYAGTTGGAVLAELDPTGEKLLFSTYLSGFSYTYGTGVATDPEGNIYVAGRTYNATQSVPTTAGAFQTSYGGGSYDAFAIKISPLDPSTTNLTLSLATIDVGQSETVMAKVTGQTGAPVPTGTVTFLNGAKTLGLSTLNASGTATFTTSRLAAGTYSLTAHYNGNPIYFASTSAAQALTFQLIATQTVFTATPATTAVGSIVKLVAEVAPLSGTVVPTGIVTFMDGTKILAKSILSAGSATFSTATLAAGVHDLKATYSGSSTFASSSAVLIETITEPTSAAPVFSPAAGTYTSTQFVKLTSTTAGAAIYYTTDGTTPTTASTRYNATIAVTASETLKAIAVKSGFINSTVATAQYTIH